MENLKHCRVSFASKIEGVLWSIVFVGMVGQHRGFGEENGRDAGIWINYKIKWCCAKPNKRGRFSALLGPHQHALARMYIYDDRTVKKAARTMPKSHIHSQNTTREYRCGG